jgi:glycine/D-amino acid oxidase-like deaminating enzyme
MPHRFDAVVIGAGSFGAWTARELRRRGLDVALLDAYGPGNSRASSGGESRIIRMGYGPDDIYTRWAIRDLALWQELFAQTHRAETGQPLLHRTGVLWFGREFGQAVDAYNAASLDAFRRLGVPHQTLSRPDLARLYPQLALEESIKWALLETESGVLMARRAVATVVEQAIKDGVEYRCCQVAPPAGEGSLEAIFTVHRDSIAAEIFVFCCGPWLGKVFPEVAGDRIFPTRQEVFFFGSPPGDQRFGPGALPTWIDLGDEAYGMPDLEGRGLKAAIDRHGPAFDPDTGSRLPTADGAEEVRRYMARRFPALRGAPLLEARVCQYENTSSGDFLLDRHPALQNVWLAGGGSGHGFKHGPSVGDYIAKLILEGGPAEPRFSLATKLSVQKRQVF